MGQTLTRYILTGSNWIGSDSGTRITDTSGNQLSMAVNEFPIKMTISGQISRVASVNGNGALYLCDNSASISYSASPAFYIICSADGVTTMTHTNPAWKTFVGGSLKGQPLALRADGNYHHSNRWEVKIYTHYCIGAPGAITVPTSASDIFTLSWGASTANDGTIAHYEIQARDRANSSASWGGWFTLNTSTSTSASVSPNTSNDRAQRQYRIRAIGTDTAYNSDWNTSGNVTYLAGVPQTVIQFEIITAATGKTYEI